MTERAIVQEVGIALRQMRLVDIHEKLQERKLSPQQPLIRGLPDRRPTRHNLRLPSGEWRLETVETMELPRPIPATYCFHRGPPTQRCSTRRCSTHNYGILDGKPMERSAP